MTTWRAGVLGTLALTGAVAAGASGAVPAEAAGIQAFRFGGVRLGVHLEEVAADQAASLGLDGPAGARVVEVVEGSPAAEAGIRAGDVILAYDGEEVRGVAHLSRLVRETPPGRQVSIELVRDGKRQSLRAAPEEQRMKDLFGEHSPLRGLELPERFAFDYDAPGHGPGPVWGFLDDDRPRLGIRYQEISGQLADYFGVAGDRGVLVVHVDPDSPAERAGLEAGDVLVELAGRRVADGGDLRRALDEAEAGEPASVEVLRRGQQKSLEVVLEARRPPRPPAGEAL